MDTINYYLLCPIAVLLAMNALSCNSALSPEAGPQEPTPQQTPGEDYMQSQQLSEGNWQQQESGTDLILFDVHFVDGQTGWAVGDITLHTTDGGQTWQELENIGGGHAVHFVDTNTGWIVGSGANDIWHTSDGGQNWQSQINLNSFTLNSVQFLDAQTGWIVGNRGDGAGIFLYTIDGGQTWEEQSHNSLNSVFFTDQNNGWILENMRSGLNLIQLFQHTSDGGESWQTRETLIDNRFMSIQFVDAQTGWVVGDDGNVLHTADSGQTWQEQESGTENSLHDLSFINAQAGWIAGTSGTLLYTPNGGQTWQEQDSGTTVNLNALHFVDTPEGPRGWAVGNNGTILHYSVDNTDLNPEELLVMLIQQVNDLQDDGVLNRGQTRGLLATLEAASRQINRGNFRPAGNQIGAFTNRVEAFQRNGTLSEEQAGELIAMAENVLQAMMDLVS